MEKGVDKDGWISILAAMLRRIFPSEIGQATVLMLAACSLMAAGSTASAAVLLGSVNTAPTGTADLSAIGTVDWAVWGTTSSTQVANMPVGNEKAGGTLVFSPITTTSGTGNVRGGVASTQLFTYSDGANTASLSPQTIGLVFHPSLNVVGSGVDFTVTGDPDTEYVIQIWGSGQNGQGTLTASLPGATSVTLLSQTYGGLPKGPTLFTINYRPDNEGDVLTIAYNLTSQTAATDDNSHVGITAAAVFAVPEPGVASLLVLGMSGVGLRRRRR